jgi:hypothetical protein
MPPVKLGPASPTIDEEKTDPAQSSWLVLARRGSGPTCTGSGVVSAFDTKHQLVASQSPWRSRFSLLVPPGHLTQHHVPDEVSVSGPDVSKGWLRLLSGR